MNRQRVLITGASGLIGRELVRRFLAEDWFVIAQIRSNSDSLTEFSNQIEIKEVDLSKPGNGRAILRDIGHLDLVINNAADQSILLPQAAPDGAIENMFRVNLFAPLELMAASKEIGVSLCINISSIEAESARPGHEIYGASKAALESLTRSLAVAFAPMRINGVRLGLIGEADLETRWPEGVAAWRDAVPSKRYAKPGEVSNFVFEITKDAFQYTTGAIFDFDGGKSASPGW